MVDQDDRLVVHAELAPGDDLERLVQRAHAAGQNDEGLGQVEHHALAGVHAVDDLEFREAAVAELGLLQVFRDDADDLATRRQRGFRDRTHEADAAAAIDQAMPFCPRARPTSVAILRKVPAAPLERRNRRKRI